MPSTTSLTCQILLVLLLLGLCLPAWGQDRRPVPPTTTQPAATQPADAPQTQPAWIGPLERAMLTWQDNLEEQAVQQLLAIRWDQLRFHPDSVFGRKEEDLPSLSPQQRQALVEEALEASKLVRQLCRHVAQLAGESARQAQYRQAEQQLLAVRKCGLAIAGPDALAIMRLTGIAIQKSAIQKLIAIYEATDRKAEQAAAQQALDDLSRQQAEIVRESQRAVELHQRRPQAPPTQSAR